MMSGISLSLRIARHSAKPSISGSITSRMATSKPPWRSWARPAPGRVAWLSCRSKRAKYAASGAPNCSSSSISRMRGIRGLCTPPSASPAMHPPVAVLHEVAHLRLLRRGEAVVEVRQGGNHFRALGRDCGGLLRHQRLRPGAVELVAGNQRLDLRARFPGLAREGGALLMQLVGQHHQALLLVFVQIELIAHAVDHPVAEFGAVLGAHVPAMLVVAVAASCQAAHDDGGAEQAEEGASDPGFH